MSCIFNTQRVRKEQRAGTLNTPLTLKNRPVTGVLAQCERSDWVAQFWGSKTHLEGDGLLQDIKEELQLEQRSSVSWVGGQREEAVLLAPGQQVLLKQPGELLQGGSRQGQRAAAVQHHIAWRVEETSKFLKGIGQF